MNVLWDNFLTDKAVASLVCCCDDGSLVTRSLITRWLLEWEIERKQTRPSPRLFSSCRWLLRADYNNAVHLSTHLRATQLGGDLSGLKCQISKGINIAQFHAKHISCARCTSISRTTSSSVCNERLRCLHLVHAVWQAVNSRFTVAMQHYSGLILTWEWVVCSCNNFHAKYTWTS